jgi:predicted nucleic acid-binding protein
VAYPSALVDSGAFVARYADEDDFRPKLEAFLVAERRRRRFGHWYTTDAVVGESYTAIARGVGRARAQEFLHAMAQPDAPRVLHAPWAEVAGFLLAQDPKRLPKGLTWVDAGLHVAARKLGIRHVLTVNGKDFRPFGLEPLP